MHEITSIMTATAWPFAFENADNLNTQILSFVNSKGIDSNSKDC